MDKFDIIQDYSEEEIINYLNDFGKCKHSYVECSKGDFGDRIYVGRVTEVCKVIRRGSLGNRPHDTLTVYSKCLSDDVVFRIIFFGKVVTSLVDANISKCDVIAVLQPAFFKAFDCLSLRVGPGANTTWIGKNCQRKPFQFRNRSKDIKLNAITKPSSERDNSISTRPYDSDNDPSFFPSEDASSSTAETVSEELNDMPQECRNTNTPQTPHSSDSTSITSLSIHVNHEVYRSQPVNYKELSSGSKEGEIRNVGRSSTPLFSIDKRQKSYEHNEFREEPCNNLLSQNTAVAGSSRQLIDTPNYHNFVAPIDVKAFKKNSVLNRTRDTHRTGCTRDTSLRSCCQARSCCARRCEIHCSHHNCSSCLPDCCRPSCRCQPCRRHCCSPPSHACSHARRSERDCFCRMPSSISCHCRSHLERSHSHFCQSSKSTCSSSCRVIDKSCCCRHNNVARSCCSDAHHPPSEYNSHSNKMPHPHQQRQDGGALKSLEQLLEQQSNNINSEEQLDSLDLGSSVDSVKRTQEWIQDWTPSLPPQLSADLPPHPKSPRIHIVPSNIAEKTGVDRLRTSGSSSSSSESENSKSKRKTLGKQVRIIPNEKSKGNTLIPNSSQSTGVGSEGIRSSGNFLSLFRVDGRQKKKRKLFDIKQNTSIVSQKSVDPPPIIEESTPFTSEQTCCSNSANLKLQPPSSAVQGNCGITEPTINSKKLEERTSHKQLDSPTKRINSVDSGSSPNQLSSKEKTIDKGDNISNIAVLGDLENEKTHINGSSAMDIDYTLTTTGNNVRNVSESNENSLYLDKTLDTENFLQKDTSQLNQVHKSSEETFPELKLDSSTSDERHSSDNASVSHSKQDINTKTIESMPNKSGIHGRQLEEKLNATREDVKITKKCNPNEYVKISILNSQERNEETSSNYDNICAEGYYSNKSEEERCLNDKISGEKGSNSKKSEEESSSNNKISDENSCSNENKSEERSIPNTQKSLSLSDYNKIKSAITDKEELNKDDNTIAVSSHCRNNFNEENNPEPIDETVEQMELVCKPKKRKKKASSIKVGSSSDSVKSVQTIDLTKPDTSPSKDKNESVLSTPSTFFDAQSHCSVNSKASSLEKRCTKSFDELNFCPEAIKTYENFLTSFNVAKPSYKFELNETFKILGIIIDTVPKIKESPLSLVKGFCNERCRTAYEYSEYMNMDEISISCSFCSYRSHWNCPHCSKEGKMHPLCMFYSFELHIFDGYNVLRVEVDNKEAGTFLGMTPTTFLKNPKRAINKFLAALANPSPFESYSVPRLSASIKTVRKSGVTILLLQNTTLKANLTFHKLNQDTCIKKM